MCSQSGSRTAVREHFSLIWATFIFEYWLLIIADHLFMMSGITLAILALKATSERVHRFQTRLSMAGLSAQPIDLQHGQHACKNDRISFDQNLNISNDREQDLEQSEEEMTLEYDVGSQHAMPYQMKTSVLF
jgi:hypothetical protein